jgi:protein SCO1/2
LKVTSEIVSGQRIALKVGVLLSALVLVAQLLLAAPDSLPSYDRVQILDPGRSISDAELTDQDGRPFRLSELRGRVALVFFGFTHCPDVCPMAMQRLRQLEESGDVDMAGVAIVMISVDGERDSPAAMKSYLAQFSPRFIGLTGEPATVKPIAAEFSAAFFKGSETETGDYMVSHSPQVFAMDTDGLLRAEFYGAPIEAMAGMTRALLDMAGN